MRGAAGAGRAAAVACAIAGAAVLGWAGLAGADPPTGATDTYAVTTMSMPTSITDGPDGNLWFAEPDAGNIGTITTSGALTEYPATPPSDEDTPAVAPIAIAAGPAGSGLLWFIYRAGDFADLGQITTSGKVSFDYAWRTAPDALAADSNGNLYVVLPGGGQPYVDELSAPYTSPGAPIYLPAGSDPGSITAGPDGTTMWVTEPGIDSVASIAGGVVTQYPLETGPGTLGNIVAGPDGNLWVGIEASFETDGPLAGVVNAAEIQPPALLAITPAGSVEQFDLPDGSNADPEVLGVGPDGRLWMPDGVDGDGGLTAASTSGSFDYYPEILPAGDQISSIVRDPGNADALWLTDRTSAAIYSVPLVPPAVTTAPPSGASGASGLSGASTTTDSSTTTTEQAPADPAETLSATLTPVSGVTRSAATVSGTISELPGTEPTAVSYSFDYGTSTAYGAATPQAPALATGGGGAPVSASLTGLTAYTTYHYRLVVSCTGTASCQSVSDDGTFTTGSTLQPQLHTSVGVTTTAGTILVKLRGAHRFVRLSAGQLIPLGSTINARHGTVLIQSATAAGGGQLASGLFSHGIFVLSQPAGGTVTQLTLQSDFADCVAAATARAPLARAAAAGEKAKKKAKKPERRKKKKKTKKKRKRKSKKKTKVSNKLVNQVFGNAHGQFKTRGHYATAADQGTGWRTADRCDGTLVAVSAGRVTVTDLRLHRTLVVTAGHSYLARSSG